MCRVCLVLLTVGLFGACAPSSPFQDAGPPRPEALIQARAAAFLIQGREEEGHASRYRAICIGVGRRVDYALGLSRRNETWDPNTRFRRALGPQSLPVLGLSKCQWTGNEGERVIETGEPAYSIGIREILWVTPRLARIRIQIPEEVRGRRRFECDAQLMDGDWALTRCIDLGFRRAPEEL